MTAFERRHKILDLLREKPAIRVTELAVIFGVSQGTIRNDLRLLTETDQINRVRGGVEARNGYEIRNSAFLARTRIRADAKEWIAGRAADMLQDGDAILLDDSTTVFKMMPYLAEYRGLTIVTNNLELAQALQDSPSHTVILVGGVLRPGAVSATGQPAEHMLESLHVKTAFLSYAAYDINLGFTDPDIQTAQLKAKMVAAAQQAVVLLDSSKFGKVHLAACANTDRITHIVTDTGLDASYLEAMRKLDLTLTVCGPNASSASYAPAAQASRHFRIGFANMDEAVPFAVEVRRSVEMAAQKAGNIDLIVADNQHDGAVALQVADGMIGQKVDLVIEYQAQVRAGGLLMAKFQQAGIPCIAVDVPIVGATFFGVDSYRAGHVAGAGLGQWINRHWHGRVDRVFALESPAAGPLPAARLEGQIDGLRETLGTLSDETIVCNDCGDTREETTEIVRRLLERFPRDRHIVLIAVGDHIVVFGLEAARLLRREQDVVAVSQGADRQIRREMRRPNTRVVGAAAFRPEKYGEGLINLACAILSGEPTPPAVYLKHDFVTPENIDEFYPEPPGH